MRTIDITEFERHPAQIVRLVEAGEIIQLARGGHAVMRMVPEPAARPDDLTAEGIPTPVQSPRRAPEQPVPPPAPASD